jgi:hypothetical protein
MAATERESHPSMGLPRGGRPGASLIRPPDTCLHSHQRGQEGLREPVLHVLQGVGERVVCVKRPPTFSKGGSPGLAGLSSLLPRPEVGPPPRAGGIPVGGIPVGGIPLSFWGMRQHPWLDTWRTSRSAAGGPSAALGRREGRDAAGNVKAVRREPRSARCKRRKKPMAIDGTGNRLRRRRHPCGFIALPSRDSAPA